MDLEARMKIIAAFKATPGLWDKSCEEFKKMQKKPAMKANLWIQVAKNLAESGIKVQMDGLKKAWSHTRIQFMAYFDPSQQTDKARDYELAIHEKLNAVSEMFFKGCDRTVAPKKNIVVKVEEKPSSQSLVLDDTLPPRESVVPDSQESPSDVTLPVTQPPVSTEISQMASSTTPIVVKMEPSDEVSTSTASKKSPSPTHSRSGNSLLPPVPRDAYEESLPITQPPVSIAVKEKTPKAAPKISRRPSEETRTSSDASETLPPPVPSHANPSIPPMNIQKTSVVPPQDHSVASQETFDCNFATFPLTPATGSSSFNLAMMCPPPGFGFPSVATGDITLSVAPRSLPRDYTIELRDTARSALTPARPTSNTDRSRKTPPSVPKHTAPSTPKLVPPPVPKHAASPTTSAQKRHISDDDSGIPHKKRVSIAIQTEPIRPEDVRVSFSQNDLRSLKITLPSETGSKRKVERKIKNVVEEVYDEVAEEDYDEVAETPEEEYDEVAETAPEGTQYDEVAQTAPFSQPSYLPIRDYTIPCIASQYSAPLPPLPNASMDFSQYMASMQMLMGTPYDQVHQTMYPMFESGTFYDPVATYQSTIPQAPVPNGPFYNYM